MNESLNRYFSLVNRTALVTGASGGIGRALAVGLAGAGATVGIQGRSAALLDETRKLIKAGGGRAVSLLAELDDLSQCRQLVADARRSLGRLDILVNCAGMNRRKPIVDVGEEDFNAILQVNLRSIYFLSQAVHPIMKSQGGGKIIQIASLTSSIALGGTSVYGITKAALAQLAKTQAVEWAKDNIQVNCLAPGFIITPLTEKPLWGEPKTRKWLLDRIPANRPGTPDDMVATTLLLAGPSSAYLTGQMITVVRPARA